MCMKWTWKVTKWWVVQTCIILVVKTPVFFKGKMGQLARVEFNILKRTGIFKIWKDFFFESSHSRAATWHLSSTHSSLSSLFSSLSPIPLSLFLLPFSRQINIVGEATPLDSHARHQLGCRHRRLPPTTWHTELFTSIEDEDRAWTIPMDFDREYFPHWTSILAKWGTKTLNSSNATHWHQGYFILWLF